MKIAKLVSAFAGLVLGASALQANAIPFEVDITVDNSYALYYGTETTATNFVGSNGSWYEAEHYSFDLPSSNFIYVVTESDVATAQGFLAQFTNLLTNQRFYSNDSQWQVTATGRRGSAPYSGSAADLSELSSQLVAANNGSNPSGGWVATTAGAANGASPWGSIATIDANARWSWYNSNGSVDPTIGGFDHNEYLVFRISVGAAEVPEPSTIMLLSLGLLGLVVARKRNA
ncbi:MAG TPA: PEP-CTERM sorting domain-containing protein [Cellvibrio sp.]